MITRGRKPRRSLSPPDEYISQWAFEYDGWEDEKQGEELPKLWRPEEIVRTRQCKKCRTKFVGSLSFCSECAKTSTTL